MSWLRENKKQTDGLAGGCVCWFIAVAVLANLLVLLFGLRRGP